MNTSYEQYGDNYEPESSYERSPSYDDSPPSAIYGASANNAEAYYSEVEAAILRSADEPISVNEADEITAAGQRGIYANKAEVVNWRGPLPITDYPINDDSNPEVITKRVTQQLEYVQELAIRYLRPPTPPSAGEIVCSS